MTLPPLQFAILDLTERQTPGATIRAALANRGIRKSGPSFYQVMARLEDAGLVRGEYVYSQVNGQPIKERVYTRTAKGAKQLALTREFFA